MMPGPELLPPDGGGPSRRHVLLTLAVALAGGAAYVGLSHFLRLELTPGLSRLASTISVACVVAVLLWRLPALRRSWWPWLFYGACAVCLPLAVLVARGAVWLAALPVVVLLVAFVAQEALAEYRAVRAEPKLLDPPSL